MTRESHSLRIALAGLLITAAPWPARAQTAPPAAGTLVVQVTPPAVLYVDGRPIGETPAASHRARVNVGVHRVRVVHADYLDWRRTIEVRPGSTVTLTLALAEQGVRRSAQPPSARGRGAATPPRPLVSDADLARGIQFVTEGDFAPALETLQAVTRNLAGPVGMIGQRALAYFYLGVCWLEIGRPEEAVRAFAVARSLDRTLAPKATEFSVQVLQAWENSRSVRADEDAVPLVAGGLPPATTTPPLTSPPPPTVTPPVATPPPSPVLPPQLLPAPPPPTPRPTSATPAPATTTATAPTVTPSATAAPPVPSAPPTAESTVPSAGAIDPLRSTESDFIADSPEGLTFQFVMATPGKPCPGVLTVEREREVLGWMPVASDCPPSFEVPFAEVRSPAAAPYGGLLVQFRSNRPSVVLMPAPDADLLAPGAERLTLNDLPPDTKVNIRYASRRLLEALHRPPSDSLFGLVDVSLTEMLDSPSDFEGGIVRTRGRLSTTNPSRGPYQLTEESSTVQLVPTSSGLVVMKSKAGEWNGKDLIVTGTFSRPAITRASATPNRPTFVLTASKVEPADELKYSGPARTMTIEQLVKTPLDRRQLVRVIGKFRGQDFFGDLPLDTRRTPLDWVIKDQVFSIWVTGKPPAGDGFTLQGSAARDVFSYWLAVTGTVEERRGYVYLRASKVELTTSPDTNRVVDPKLPTGAARTRADISFTVPVEGLEEASRSERILLQFTKPMDEASLKTQVRLRYADGRPGTFPRLSVTYYETTRSVMIDPGTSLQPDSTLECVLLPGVKDRDNLPLVGVDNPTGRVIRWKVGRNK